MRTTKQAIAFSMFVIKRTNESEEVSFDKVLKRIKVLSENLQVNFFEVAQKVCSRIYDGVKTSELDELAAQMCSSMILDHPDYGTLASRIIISNHHKNTSPSFSETIQTLYDNKDIHNTSNPLLSDELYEIVKANKEKLNSYLDYTRDFKFDYFGFKTLEKAYLMRVNGRVIERPQHMFMRVALGIHGGDIKDALQTYDMMSTKHFVHATPTLFNSGTRVPQMSSCYLYGMDDSIDGIFKCLKDCAHISKYAGGIGVHIHNVRARNSTIRGTNGISTGIVPMLRVYNNTARYVNQCFAPETLVMTIDGAKRIDEVRVHDKVLTSDGSHRRVLGIAKNELHNDTLLEFMSPFMSEPVRVTKVHELYTWDLTNDERKFIAAEDFDIARHMMAIPCEVEGSVQVELDDVTEDFIRFCGMFRQSGRVFSNGNDYSIKCSNAAAYLLAIKVLKAYGMRHWVYHNKSNAHRVVRWVKSALVPTLVNTRIAFENGKKGAIAYLDGLFMNGFDEDYITTSCRSTALEFQVVAANAGTILKVYTDVDGVCVMRRAHHNQGLSIIDSNSGLVWFKVDSVRSITYSGNVYDLNVEDNHNYTTSMGLVHNSGRRNGSIAIYMEPWHGDIEHFVEMRKNHGNEEERARDLFYALWIPDLFMQRVQEDAMWSLMCPDQCKGLSDCYGEEFDKLYTSYESQGKFIKQVKAQDLWFKILESQIETGTPYMLYKDHVNRKNMQKNIGIIKSSNLCVAPDTMILTSVGEREIRSLKDQTVMVWNGKQFSRVIVTQTGTNQKLLTVKFNNGKMLKCTPYHKFYITAFSIVTGDDHEIVKEARDLKVNDVISTFTLSDGSVHTGVKVVGVEDNGVISDTYCFTEPIEHKGVFNGILTGQCSEIVEVSDDKTCAVCNLASMCLPTYVDPTTRTFNYDKLHEAVKIVVKNLNKVIDRNFYPIEEAKTSNLRDRPIGVGVQGLADVFAIMKLPYESVDARIVNKQIFETMYHAALESSMELAKKLSPYETFPGSPASEGTLQFDLWGVTPSDKYDWDNLRAMIKEHGLRNSLLLAPMPTASTSQVMGFTESFEPITSNVYKRKTLAGEFILVNRYLVNDLQDIGLWTPDVKNHITVDEGSIQNITQIPQEIRDRYKTVWECKMRSIIDMAADRGAFIDQSQSMNLYVENPDFKKLTAMHFHAWNKGLKTGMYYLRSKAKSSAQKFTMDPRLEKQLKERNNNMTALNPVDEQNICETCSA